ncbi:MAG: sugar ABC transporter permease, partial [Bacilli bacterium]
KKIFQTIFFIPYVTNAIAVGMVFAVIFDGFGLWNFLFGLVMPTYWVDMGADPSKAMFALCVYIIWHSLPYKILIFLSGLQNIDKQYYDAAKVDSASRFKTFTSFTVPLLSPQIFYIMITSFIGAFKEYSSVMGLLGKSGTAPGNNNMYTVVFYIYDSIDNGNVHLGAAAAVLLFLVILSFTGIQFWISKKRVHY